MGVAAQRRAKARAAKARDRATVRPRARRARTIERARDAKAEGAIGAGGGIERDDGARWRARRERRATTREDDAD